MNPIERRKAICENEHAYLPNGLKCGFGGYGMPIATISSKAPGGYRCAWETVEAVLQRPDRRFRQTELSRSSLPWLGLPVEPEDFQTVEDYENYRKANL